jgi:hypothetical protein
MNILKEYAKDEMESKPTKVYLSLDISLTTRRRFLVSKRAFALLASESGGAFAAADNSLGVSVRAFRSSDGLFLQTEGASLGVGGFLESLGASINVGRFPGESVWAFGAGNVVFGESVGAETGNFGQLEVVGAFAISSGLSGSTVRASGSGDVSLLDSNGAGSSRSGFLVSVGAASLSVERSGVSVGAFASLSQDLLQTQWATSAGLRVSLELSGALAIFEIERFAVVPVRAASTGNSLFLQTNNDASLAR